MDSHKLKQEIEKLRAELAPKEIAMRRLERDYRDALSREFISANGITADQVELSSGESKPYFGHIREFIKWLIWQRPRKRWAEWNGTLYRVSDLIANNWSESPARVHHVPIGHMQERQ